MTARRNFFFRLRCCLPASRRSREAAVGRVLIRCFGFSDALRINWKRRSRASCRLRSCVRYRSALITSVPSEVIRLPARRIKRCLVACGSEGERSTSNRNKTAVATLLTFCPPGPEARINSSRISFSCTAIAGGFTFMTSFFFSVPSEITASIRGRSKRLPDRPWSDNHCVK